MKDTLEIDGSEEKPSKLKKVYIAILGIILIIIIATYFIPGSFVLQHIEGQLVSGDINNYEVALRDGSVIFDPNVYDKLLEIYTSDPKNEQKACLIGYKENKDYKITDMYKPKSFLRSLISVNSEACNSKTIIDLHSHPFKQCSFSKTDLGNYDKLKAFNKDAILGLMCDETRFTFYPN